jgi:hypothetical protein
MGASNRVEIGLSYCPQATWDGGINSLESIPGLLKRQWRKLDLSSSLINKKIVLILFIVKLTKTVECGKEDNGE